MGLLEVDTAGLRALAARCLSWAAEVGELPVPDTGGLPRQATFAAVNAVDADSSVAASNLAARLQSTSAQLTAAGDVYSTTEQNSAVVLNELTTRL